MRLSLAILMTFVFAGAAIGAEHEQSNDLVERYKTIFSQLDADGSNSLSEEEAAAAGLTGDGFKRLDQNGDDELSLDEFLVLAAEAEAMTPDTSPADRGW